MDPVTEQGMRALVRRTEPDTAHLRRGKVFLATLSRAALSALLFFICCGLPLLVLKSAQAEEKDVVLPESGIHYPGGFDQNTVGEVQGKAYGYLQPEKGPVQFRVVSEKETYIVLVAPRWYWNELGGKITDGTEVRVHGSKSLGKDGNLYIIAQEMRIIPSGKAMVFRDEDGFPLWKGPKAGTQGGFGSSQRGMGGMGSGPGGMGRGRR
jgi:hypothetical protein